MPPDRSSDLSDWLRYLEHLHPVAIDLGLSRVAAVAERLSLLSVDPVIITVAGTNGKGSTVALLESVYLSAGYSVGAYTSPHITEFNERIRINGEAAVDSVITQALYRVEQARLPDSLTYFEHTTLGAMQAFVQHQLQVVILEVGLGGRLDATNIWDTDCAIVTSIALDHQEYLGDNVSDIAVEKVSIGRRDRPMLIGESNPPLAMLERASDVGMLVQLPEPSGQLKSALKGEHQQRNAACVMAAVQALQCQLPVNPDTALAALVDVRVPGRFETRQVDDRLVVLDVAHNPAAASALAETLRAEYPDRPVHAVCSMMADKDIVGVAAALHLNVSRWYCASVDVPRAAAVDELVSKVLQGTGKEAKVRGFRSVTDAFMAALNSDEVKHSNGLVLIVGSFFTVSALQPSLQSGHT
ncbi:MAG: bifunctional folylpolyglutamate synthase/dihydrofolate synthase [Gammaproteobacteria bacterium]|nr:bifunctional folylpolyglutamate synthase/dihydrofolate synthase [Gammaproteobacteria bacterium]